MSTPQKMERFSNILFKKDPFSQDGNVHIREYKSQSSATTPERMLRRKEFQENTEDLATNYYRQPISSSIKDSGLHLLKDDGTFPNLVQTNYFSNFNHAKHALLQLKRKFNQTFVARAVVFSRPRTCKLLPFVVVERPDLHKVLVIRVFIF